MKWSIIDEDTGEIIATSTNFRLEADTGNDDVRLRTNVKGSGFSTSSIHMSQDIEGDVPDIEDGDYVYFSRNLQFVKMWKGFKVNFEVEMYELYLRRLCQDLDQNTNAICHRDRCGRVRWCETKAELAKVAGCSLSTFYAFYRVAFKKGYIGKFETGGQTMYPINPIIAINGQKISRAVYEYFNKVQSAVFSEYSEFNRPTSMTREQWLKEGLHR